MRELPGHPAPQACDRPPSRPSLSPRRPGLRCDRRSRLRGDRREPRARADRRMNGTRPPARCLSGRACPGPSRRGRRAAPARRARNRAGSAALAAVLSGRLVMQDRALAQATASCRRASARCRSRGSAPSAAPGARSTATSRGARRLTGREPVRAMLYREAQVNSHFVNLRGADDLARWVTCVGRPAADLRADATARSCGSPASGRSRRNRRSGSSRSDGNADAERALSRRSSSRRTPASRRRSPLPPPAPRRSCSPRASTALADTRARPVLPFVRVVRATAPGDVHPWTVGSYTRPSTRCAPRWRRDPHASSDGADRRPDRSRRRLTRRRPPSAPARRRDSALSCSPSRCSQPRRCAARSPRRDGGCSGPARDAGRSSSTPSPSREPSPSRRRSSAGCSGARRRVRRHRAGSPPGPWSSTRCSRARPLAAFAAVAASALLLYLAVRAPAVQLGRLAITPLDVAALAALDRGRGRLRARLGRTQLARRRRHERVRAARAGARHLRRRGRRGAAARARAPRARTLGRRGPVSFRLAALSLARNPGGASSRRRSSSRASGWRSSPRRIARRCNRASRTRPPTPLPRRTCSTRISASSSPCCMPGPAARRPRCCGSPATFPPPRPSRSSRAE